MTESRLRSIPGSPEPTRGSGRPTPGPAWSGARPGNGARGRSSSDFLRAAPESRVRPAEVTHRAKSSRKITLLQQPEKTRPTAKAGCIGAGKGSERAEEAPAYTAIPGNRAAASSAAQRIASVPARRCPRGPPRSPLTARRHRSRGPRSCSSQAARPHSFEGASESRPDSTSQDAVRPDVKRVVSRLCLTARAADRARCLSGLSLTSPGAGLAGK